MGCNINHFRIAGKIPEIAGKGDSSQTIQQGLGEFVNVGQADSMRTVIADLLPAAAERAVGRTARRGFDIQGFYVRKVYHYLLKAAWLKRFHAEFE
jgi:hypothetical protein